MIGKLVVIVKEARNLLALDVGGTVSTRENTYINEIEYPHLNTYVSICWYPISVYLLMYMNISSSPSTSTNMDIKQSDPYVTLKLETQEHKTTTKKKTLSPQWNQAFEL